MSGPKNTSACASLRLALEIHREICRDPACEVSAPIPAIQERLELAGEIAEALRSLLGTLDRHFPSSVNTVTAHAAREAIRAWDAQPPASPEPAPALPLGHEFKGCPNVEVYGRCLVNVDGCHYRSDLAGWCAEPLEAHLPEPAPFATVEALKASVAEGQHNFVPGVYRDFLGRVWCALCLKIESEHAGVER
jgi:hypothetical protein